jgi:hypothetical protein
LTGAADGLGAALDAALDEAGPMLFPDPEQVELALGDGPRDTVTIQRALEEVRRGAGRPRGSANKRTGKLRDYLASRYTHPLEVLAATAAQPDEHLAADLGCSKHEARQLRVRAASELAPYMESKMPVAIQATGAGHMTLVLGAAIAAGAPDAAIEGVGMPVIIGPAPIQNLGQNQGVDLSAGEKSE